jgi:ATP-dependent exoDNAse (exonuclease V) beta subunit
LEGGTRLRAARVLAPRAETSLNIGTLFHAWLEQFEWLDDGLPSDQTLRQIAAKLRHEIGDFSPHLSDLIARFRQQLSAPAIAAVLHRSFYAAHSAADPPLAIRERAFAIRTGDELLSGSIDRLVLLRSRGQIFAADILDFKTDELPPNDSAALAAKVEFYQPQIRAYRRAVARILNLQSSLISARLVFLSTGEIRLL